MMWVHRHFMSPFPFRAYYQSNPMIADLKLSGEPVRVKIFQEDPLLHQYLSTLFPYYGVESLDVSAASRTPADYRAFFDALKDQPSRFWLLGGVRYLAVNGDELARLQADPALVSNVHQTYFYRADGTSLEQIDLKKVNRSQGFSHAVVEFKDFLPRVSLVPQVRVVKDGAEVLKVLTEPKFRPQDTMVVTTAEGPAGWPEKSTGAVAPIKIQHYEPGRMEWQTELTQPGLVLINQRFEAGWRAEINGKPVPIFRANYLMMGLSVPPGKCAVVLQYAPSLKTVYASTAVWLLLGFWAWQRERRRRY
jgi:hypothetical protein